MSQYHCVDSSGWIEYFQDSPQADVFAPAIERTSDLIVPVIAIFEVKRFISRWRGAVFAEACLDVMRRGKVADLTDARASLAADLAAAHGLAFADAAMYAIARDLNATFWTQDIDYNGLPGVEFRAKPAPGATLPDVET